MITNEDLHLMRDVAKACGRTPQTIRRWIREQKVPYQRKVESARGRLLFDTDEKNSFVSYATGIKSEN
ncbi:MAG: MerR family transcriptional regulator [Candidatus Sedimenticola sp. (ex Thyasira tokunagai)]